MYPRLEPYLEVPNRIENIENALEGLSSGVEHPEFIEFKGIGTVIESGEESLTVAYLLRRSVSCEVRVNIRYWDVDRGLFRVMPPVTAVKSPVSDSFTPFKIDLKVGSLPKGRYSYIPTLKPLECGIYKSVTAPMSEVFTID